MNNVGVYQMNSAAWHTTRTWMSVGICQTNSVGVFRMNSAARAYIPDMDIGWDMSDEQYREYAE